MGLTKIFSLKTSRKGAKAQRIVQNVCSELCVVICIVLFLGIHTMSYAANEQSSALMRLARLQQLSGNIESAAGKYFEAAALETGNAKNEALASGAFCLAAMGEWEKAAAAIAPVLRDGNGITLLRACYLEACARAWLLSDTSRLRSLAENPAFREIHSAIYYTLWKLAEGRSIDVSKSPAEWRTLLVNEFPNSPEGRMAKNDDTSSGTADTVSLRQAPFWLLLPGQEGWKKEATPAVTEFMPASVPAPTITVTPTASAAAPAAAADDTIIVVKPPSPVPQAQQAPENIPPTVNETVPTRSLQTGFFSKEANALAQIEQLKTAGFTTATIHRVVRENVYWAVTVPAGQNMNTTIAALKKAGFESFPLPAN